MQKTFLNKITYLAFISSLIIVSLNTTQGIEPINQIDEALNNALWNLVDNFSSLAYAFLYTMIGAILFYKKESLKTKLINIVKFLFAPYLIWQIGISTAKVLVLKQSIASLRFIETVFLLKDFPPDGPLYHLYLAFFMCLISLLLTNVFSNKKHLKKVIITLSLISFILLNKISIPSSLFQGLFSYYPAFLLGILYGQIEENISTVLILFLLTLILDSLSIKAFDTFIFMSLPYLILISININSHNNITKYLFLIYAIHPVFIAIICPIVQSLIFSAFIVNILSIILVITLSIITSWLMYQIIKRTVPFLLPYITCNKD